MKKFNFRLQRLRDLRAAKEQARLAEFGREQQQLQAEQQKLTLFLQEKDTQVLEMRLESGQAFTAWSRRVNHGYLQRIARVVEYQAGRVTSQKEEVEAARLRYLDARQDTMVMDKVREFKLEEWKRDVFLEEGKNLDEVASRKRGEE
jgi:flagellar export protein FliJ